MTKDPDPTSTETSTAETAHSDSSPPPRAWRRATHPHNAPRPRPRFHLLAIALAVVATLFLLGPRGLNLARAWLQTRPEYRCPIREIRLVPPPPPYIRGGAPGLLARAERQFGHSNFHTLTGDLGELAHALALGSPWIEEVQQLRVLGHPNALEAHLIYRTPCAYLPGPRNSAIVIDRHGVVLPRDDLDTALSGPLVAIDGWNGPLEPRPGVGLAPPGTEAENALLAATRLAHFLQQQTPADLRPERRITSLNLQAGASWMYARTGSRLRILWGEAPGSEAPGQPTAQQKWPWLQDWLDRNSPTPAQIADSYLVFTRTGAALKPISRGGSG